MTKIVLTKAETKSLNEADVNKYYGFVGASGRKGLITRENYDSGKFRALSDASLTNGNCYSRFDDDSLAGCIKKIIEFSAKITVFEFDTAQELFAWLAKE